MSAAIHAGGVDGATRLFGIVGHPVAQVKTPQLLNSLFGAGGINAVCLPFDVPVADFAQTINGLKALANLDGLVITVPHKVRALARVDALSASAHRVGAINVMRREPDGSWFGDLFDGSGLLAGIAPLGFRVAGAHIKQLGAGGAGAAVAHAMAGVGAASTAISDPQPEPAYRLVAQLNHCYPGCTARVDQAPTDVDGVDLLINCSPVGMRAGDDMPQPFGAFPAGLQVIDIIMTPAETPLLAHARRYGCRVTNGIPMIEGQLLAFARFFGITIAPAMLRR